MRESLEGKSFAVHRRVEGLIFLIDGIERYCLTMSRKEIKEAGRDWSLKYERFKRDGRLNMAIGGYENPDDPALPKVHRSMLHMAKRFSGGSVYIEITFPGKIPIRKLWPILPGVDWWRYWEVVLPEL